MSSELRQKYTITLDDDPSVSRIIEKSTGIKSIAFSSAQDLIQNANKYHPTAVFIDIHLGLESNGLSLIPTLRSAWPFCAFLVVTSDSTDEVLSEAFALGADDFLRKPIRPQELLARLQSRLGDTAEKEAKNILRMGDLSFYLTHRRLKGKRGQTYLTPMATTLLTTLMHAKGTVLKREKLKQAAWGEIVVTDNALDRKIHEIRKAIEEVSEAVEIKCSYGIGFGLELKSPVNNKKAVGDE